MYYRLAHGAPEFQTKRYNKRRYRPSLGDSINFTRFLSMNALDPKPAAVARSAKPGALRWLALAAVSVAVAGAGYFAFNSTKSVPDATFTLLSGQKVSTADLKGKVYVVNFWATDCDTCIQEMPQMVKTYNQFKGQGLEFVAVALSYDPPMYVTNYSQTRKLPFKVAMDDGSAAKQFGNVQLTPTTFVVDREGHILKRYVGQPQFAELNQLLQKALAEKAAV
jgi:peroxiredoxin